MRISLITFFASIFLSLSGFSQTVEIDSCGLTDNSLLNSHESAYFSEAFSKYPTASTFDFQNKRVLFASGNWAAMSSSKQHFFESSGKSRYEGGTFPSMQLIILTDAEKTQFDNHDAIVVTWSKIPLSEKNRKKFISNVQKRPL